MSEEFERATVVAHDLENDLAAIRMRIDLLLDSASRAEISDMNKLQSDLEQLAKATEQATARARELSLGIQNVSIESPVIKTAFSPSESSGARVLYVEDNAANVALMERIFKERPALELAVATDGLSGQRLANEFHPSLVLLDINLPDISGEEFIQQLRSTMKDKTPPIIVLSADAMTSTIERTKSLGIAEYVTKPYNVIQLFELIDLYCPIQ